MTKLQGGDVATMTSLVVESGIVEESGVARR
jgi:hypothetical protein